MTTYIDTDRIPEERRGVPCRNCGNDWHDHDGWACMSHPTYDRKRTKKSALAPRMRYQTADMVAAMAQQNASPSPVLGHTSSPSTTPTIKADPGDWKTWRDVGKDPSHCACGIKQEMCNYHRA